MRTFNCLFHLYFLCIFLMIPSGVLFGKFFDNISGIFGGYKHQEVFEKELLSQKHLTSLTINNTIGDIIIERTWKENKKVYVKAVKKAKSVEELATITLDEQEKVKNNTTHVTLSTVMKDKKAKIEVDYLLIVPEKISLHLTTDEGLIKIHEVKGPITATNKYGNIEVYNTTNTINAQTTETGSIALYQPRGNIRVTSNRGNIAIHDAMNSVIAKTERGTITTSCMDVPQTSRILLTSASGAITLALPSSVNASLQGKTERGTLTSDHYVTLKPITTKLNRNTWNRFRKEIDGTLGTGEADIRLSSNNGNIKIIESTT